MGAEVTCSAPPKPFVGDGLAGGHRLQVGRDRVLIGQVLLGDAIHVCERDAFDGLDVLVGESRPSAASAFDHTLARPGMELRSKFRIRHFAAFGGCDQLLRNAVLRIARKMIRASP